MSKRLVYKRVSSLSQKVDRQLEEVKLDKVFIDKLSCKDLERPELEELMEYARDGDSILVHSMDRLAGNLDNLRKLVSFFIDK